MVRSIVEPPAAPAQFLLSPADIAALEIPDFLKRVKPTNIVEMPDNGKADLLYRPTPAEAAHIKKQLERSAPGGVSMQCNPHTPIEELTLEEAQARLAQLVKQRAALDKAIPVYKRYVQKLMGQL